MADPFRPCTQKSGFGRALRSKRTATIEAIEGLFADAPAVRSVTLTAVLGVCEPNGVEIGRRFTSDRKHLYRRYLTHCLEDRILSEEENADLQHLARLLHLAPEDVAAVHDEVAREVYGKAIQEALADLKLDPEEETFLRRLRGELQLSDKVAADLYDRGSQEARSRAMTEASSRDRDFTVYRAAAGEFTGRSDAGLEPAIEEAISKASLAVPDLHWFEVTQIAGYVGEGKPKGWHVTLRAGIPPEE